MHHTYTYDAFGEEKGRSGSTENNYLFAGEQFDEELEEYYLRQRYYDVESGRFIRRDVYEGKQGEPLTLHKYMYAHANPVNLTDPSGKTPQLDEDFVHNAIGLHFVSEDTANRVYDPPAKIQEGYCDQIYCGYSNKY